MDDDERRPATRSQGCTARLNVDGGAPAVFGGCEEVARVPLLRAHPTAATDGNGDGANGGATWLEAGQTADRVRAKGFQVNSAKIINKYLRKYDKQQEKHHEEYDDGFDPHWGYEFFRFCWNEGMRLPSIENCPGCSDIVESSSRSYNRGNRLRQTRVSFHQRLGPVNQDHGQEDNVIRKNQWCPSGIFTKNQKRRVQRLRKRERLQEVEQEINHRLRKAKPRQEWRVKNRVPVADEAKRLAKGKSVVMAPINMAVFEKPEGTENRHLKPLYINGYVNGKPMSKMMVYSGAVVNLMPFATFRKLGRCAEDLIKTNMVLKFFGGNPSETKGVLNVELIVGMARRQDRDRANRQDTLDDLDDKQGQGFMSADDLEEIDIGPGDRPRPTFISKNLSPEFRTNLIELLKEFRDCFTWEYYEMPRLSRSIVEHRLPIKPGVRPRQQPPRRCNADMLELVKAEIKRLYDAGFIRPCRYAEWVSSIVPVIKKNGKVRVCIDFRDLNKATPKDEYPMPVADQLFCEIYSYIYHDLIGWLVEVYIDDVVLKSKEIEDHIADLRKVFERTRKYGLKMNPTKCAFGVSAGQFLGFLVQERRIEVTQRSVNAIKKIQPLENKTELQEMIGKINFVRRFISNLSGRLEPFTLLLRLKADQQFTWGAEQQKALDNIKEYLSSPPVLIPPQKGVPFRLYLSAGEKSIDLVLIQELDRKEQVVFYLSRRLLDAETRYSPVEKLCLCLYFSCTRLRHYLLSNECTVICKADVVKYMLSAPILKGRVGKWIFSLTEFDLRYESPKAIKGQAIADFIVEHRDDSIGSVEIVPWCHAQKFPNRILSRMCIKIPVQDRPGYTNDNVDIQIHVLQTS
uniref:Retrotransposon protein, putative, unclassified n=2 Tax=Oryza sativa subsp. japonica TaxID=39947 RepID=Q53MT8_ORYSJ|nr:retrotransposon protein, putative, unclassified [Oryza sativa Japonica Group]ABA92755.1 retrotransposon protein, putative, unclassified [Oryza sativa Japonica Group]